MQLLKDWQTGCFFMVGILRDIYIYIYSLNHVRVIKKLPHLEIFAFIPNDYFVRSKMFLFYKCYST